MIRKLLSEIKVGSQSPVDAIGFNQTSGQADKRVGLGGINLLPYYELPHAAGAETSFGFIISSNYL